MAEHPDVQRLRDAYDAFARGDLATLQEIWAPGLPWHVAGTSDLDDTYEGVPAVLRFVQRRGALRRHPAHRALAFYANDGYGVAVVRQSAPPAVLAEAAHEIEQAHAHHGLTDSVSARPEHAPPAEDAGPPPRDAGR